MKQNGEDKKNSVRGRKKRREKKNLNIKFTLFII